MKQAVLPVACSLLLAACASVRSHLPFKASSHAETAAVTPFHRDPHRQYFDKLHKRYYYYDLARKSYFWENGQPKG